MSIDVATPGPIRRISASLRFRQGARAHFSYTEHLEGIIRRWCRQYPQLRHIDMDQVLVCVTRCRSTSARGIYASIRSLKYPFNRDNMGDLGSGTFARHASGITKNGLEPLYLIKFYLPRFHDLSLEEKVSTILHELYHIDPKFNGKLRTFGGRCWAHGHSHGEYEDLYGCLSDEIIGSTDPVSELFLNCRFTALLERFGDIYGDCYRAAWRMEAVSRERRGRDTRVG